MPYKDKEVHRQYRIKRYQENANLLKELKVERGCIDCGYNAHHAGLEFDHREDKFKNVTAMLTYSHAKLMAEIDKCDVVCGTCHNIRTFNRRHGVR
jgi:thymidine kinase